MIQFSQDKIMMENNKLKLDNAALRAENQLLKRQVNYWENLFAKKASAPQVSYDHISSATHTNSNSGSRSCASVISGDEITQTKRPPMNMPPMDCRSG